MAWVAKPAAAHDDRAPRLSSGANTRARARLVFNLDSIGICPVIGADQTRRAGDRHDANSPTPTFEADKDLGISGGRRLRRRGAPPPDSSHLMFTFEPFFPYFVALRNRRGFRLRGRGN
jgi:hypothetical protein